MKNVFILALLLSGAMSSAQAPLVTLSVEEIPINQPQLDDLTGLLGATPHTIRVYANIPDDWEIQTVYGLAGQTLSISSSDGFYQNSLGGPISSDISNLLFAVDPLLEYDSWVTIGYDDNTNNQLIYLPLDGAFFNSFETGGDLIINDFIGASWSESALSIQFPPNTADANGQVLLGQFTSVGPINGCMNIQVRRLNPDGTIYDPPGSPVAEAYALSNLCFEFTPDVIVGSCPGDFTGDNIVGTSDLLMFTSGFGCDAGCPTDLTGDDKTTGSDVLIFLSVFGSDCN
jgi:hypothetical protein